MTQPTPRPGDQPEEQLPPDHDVEREDPARKSEAEMTPGKNYPHTDPGPHLEFDSATRRTPQGGGPD
jgi:hypothetical protein